MDIKRKAKKIINKTIELTEKAVSEGKKKLDLFRLESEKEELELLLGKKCYDLIVNGKNVLEESDVNEIVAKITSLNKQIKDLKEKSECSKCGYNLLPGAKYCPRCGAKI